MNDVQVPSTNLWVAGLRDAWGHRLLEVLRFEDRSRGKKRSATWYAHRGDKTHWLDADTIGEVHISAGLSWCWYVDPAAKLLKPPFSLTDDPCLFPAYDGAVNFRPTKLANELLAPSRFLMPIRGADWLGVFATTRGGSVAGRGHLIAFSPTGSMPEVVSEGVVMPPNNGPFGTIELTKKGQEPPSSVTN